ncbi:MAG: hypothetical protein HY909_14270 [Deltaproteobacteria bacterium]|nr:hypothetical protein [Deltaproteobacteria bacterium]
MSTPRTPEALLRAVAERLGDFRERLMFVGGSVTWLLLTDPVARQQAPRPTTDVDAVVDVTTKAQYDALAPTLRALGFTEDDRPGAPLCRWRAGEMVLDLLPTSEDVLRFSNRWYSAAMLRCEQHELPGLGAIRVARATDLLAMKLEAFHDRGQDDLYGSKDLEDVITLIDGRRELADELRSADPTLRTYIETELGRLLANPAFQEALSGFLPGDEGSQARVPLLRRTLEGLAGQLPQ